MNHFKFSTGQIVALQGIASIGSMRRDFTYNEIGRPYLEITYQMGAVVTVPDALLALDPPWTEEQFEIEYHQFMEAALK